MLKSLPIPHAWVQSLKKGFFLDFFLFMCVIQRCFICRLSDSTVSESGGIEDRTVATLTLTAWCSILRHRGTWGAADEAVLKKVPIQKFRQKMTVQKKCTRMSIMSFTDAVALIYKIWQWSALPICDFNIGSAVSGCCHGSDFRIVYL